MKPLCFVHTLAGEPFMLLNINLSPAENLRVHTEPRRPRARHYVSLGKYEIASLRLLLLCETNF